MALAGDQTFPAAVAWIPFCRLHFRHTVACTHFFFLFALLFFLHHTSKQPAIKSLGRSDTRVGV